MGHLHWGFVYFLILQFVFQPVFSAAPSVSQLSLEEKIGQLLMVHFHGEEANDEAKRLIQELHVGGIIYYNWANGLHSPQQVARLSQGLQQLAASTPHALPLLIAVDQEGGPVNRLKNGFTLFPSPYALGLINDDESAKKCARIMGLELKAVGVSLNFAPLADVYTNPANPVIGIRSFSSDPWEVSRWAGCYIQGFHEAGIVCALKHFPGHGDAAVDSHEGLPVIIKQRGELERCEWIPFRNLARHADVIMTAHLMLPALDTDNCGTLSNIIVEDLLRKELNFQGVVVTDSLAMDGILSQCSSLEEAVIKSVAAGHDLILLGGKQLLATQNGLEFSIEVIERVCKALLDAVKTGRLSERRIDEAVDRILALKQKAGLFDSIDREIPSLEAQVGTRDHQAFALHVARRALKLGKGESCVPVDFQQRPFFAVAPDFLKEEFEQTSWSKNGLQGKIVYYKGFNPDQECIQAIKEAASNAHTCVFFAYNAWKSLGQKEIYAALRQRLPFVIAVALRDPIDEKVLSSSDVLLYTYGPVSCSLQAAYDYLTEKQR